MFLDARNIPGGITLETDLCIVGAGAAGITLAREFIGSSVQVHLLEGGGLEFDAVTQTLYEAENVGLPYYPLDICRLRYFGGSTNAWGGWCRPLDPIDLTKRPWVPESGWPLSYGDLAPYYPAAHRVCQIDAFDYDPERCVAGIADPFAKILAPRGDAIETVMYTFSPPTRFGQVYEKEIREAPNVVCLLNANAANIDSNDECTLATGVDVACLGGTRFRVVARCIVLAAGGVESARLLLLSDRVMPQGLGNAYDLVGRYFMEHTHTERRLFTVSPRVPLDFYGMDFVQRRMSGRLALTPAAQERERLLQYSANIRPVYVGEETKGWDAFRHLFEVFSSKWGGDPIFRTPPYERKRLRIDHAMRTAMQPHWVAIVALAVLFRLKGFVKHYMLESKAEQMPNPDSRVRLTEKRDLLGLRTVELDWRLLPLDRHTVCRAEDIIGEEFQQLEIGRLEERHPEGLETWPADLRGGWHQLGTTRMHEDPRHGVVDADCRVHGIGNLFIAGGSVFPTSGATTPTLTVIALALRLAAHLKATAFA